MIHSLSGGVLSENNIVDIAKVQFETGEIYWYICNIENIKVGQIVLVPFGKSDKPTKAKILRIDKNVSSQTSPVPFSRMKEIICVLN